MGVFDEIAHVIGDLRVPADAISERTRQPQKSMEDLSSLVTYVLIDFFTTKYGLGEGSASGRIARIECCDDRNMIQGWRSVISPLKVGLQRSRDSFHQ